MKTQKDAVGWAIVALVVLVATSPFWLWGLSSLTGGWFG